MNIDFENILTEDTLCSWINDNKGYLHTRKIKNSDSFDFNICDSTTFVCLTGYHHILHNFFTKTIHKFKKSRIILVIIETDCVKLTSKWLNNKRLLHCFTWNPPFKHSKLSAIPIGLNYDRQYKELVNWCLNNQNKKEKKNLCCLNCSPSTNPMRSKLINMVKTKFNISCNIIDFIPNKDSYVIPSHVDGRIRVNVTNPICYDIWNTYKYVISPPGTGVDCHRTWEALCVGCIPIVLSSSLNELYKDLPILIVEDYNQISENFLNEKYDEIMLNIQNNMYDFSKLTLNYWIKKIQSKIPPKYHFITYGDEKYKNARIRLCREAAHLGIFDSITEFTPGNLTESFKTKFKDILNMKRGGGYWIWKYDIIMQMINKINHNDYLIYLDAGCKLNKHGHKRFFEYINILKNSHYGILSFQMAENKTLNNIKQPENVWTSGKIFKYFNIELDSHIATSGQYLGGVLFMKNNDHLKLIMKEYKRVLDHDPYLITDKYNNMPGNHNDFKDNRHDQSVTSIIRKIHGSEVIKGDESWVPPFGSGLSLNYPIWAMRNKN